MRRPPQLGQNPRPADLIEKRIDDRGAVGIDEPGGPPGGTEQATLELPSGQCTFRALDANAEVICDVDAMLVVRPDRPTDVRLILLCLA